MIPPLPADVDALLDDRRSRRLTLVLGDGEVRDLLADVDCVALQAQALVAHSSAVEASPERLTFGPGGGGVKAAVMPGYGRSHGALGNKLLASVPGNRERGLPRSLSTLTLLDPETGLPLAVMGSTYLTNLRTAATAVLALSLLGPATATHVGVYGSGPIATLIVRTLLQTLRLERVVVYSPTPANRLALAAAFDGRGGVRVLATSDPAEPARAEIVVAAGDGNGPLFSAADLAVGATVASVASRAHTAEVPLDAFEGALAVVDSRKGALREAGEFVLRRGADGAGAAPIHAELGEILLGTRHGRRRDDERWIFKSTGLALQDVIVARTVFLRALVAGVGTSLPLVS